MPKVSLITTFFNREKFLRETLESVAAQTFGDFEVILWDDGSTDDSPFIAQGFADKDARFKYIRAEHAGRVSALIHATEVSTGELVGILDSDDILEPSALSECVVVLDTHADAGMVYTDYLCMSETGKRQRPGRRCRIPYSRDRLLVDFMTFHFRLIRREAYDLVGGFDAAFPLAMDYDLCLKLSEVTNIHHLPCALYRYRKHRASLSATRRLEQIACSHRAVCDAIKRRGLEEHLACDLAIRARFRLREISKRKIKARSKQS